LNGYPGGRKYTFSLRGDDKSFELLDHEAMLERDKPVGVRFRTCGAPGWNIALLELRDADADVVMEDVPLAVKSTEKGEILAPGIVRITSDIPPLTSESRFFEVGSDVEAVRYQIRAPYVGPDSILSAPGIRSRDVIPPGEPVDAVHHVGPMETLESLVTNSEPGIQEVFWENRGRPEYRTPYDPPAPDVPIHAELTVTKYAVNIERQGDSLSLTNKLAAIDGRAELYDAALTTESLTGAGQRAGSMLSGAARGNATQMVENGKGAAIRRRGNAVLTLSSYRSRHMDRRGLSSNGEKMQTRDETKSNQEVVDSA
jgi:hypothetical protein